MPGRLAGLHGVRQARNSVIACGRSVVACPQAVIAYRGPWRGHGGC